VRSHKSAAVVLFCCVSGEGRKRSQLSLPATSVYTLGGHDIDLANMVGIVKPPGSAPEPCLLTKKPDGKLGMHTVYFSRNFYIQPYS